MNKSSVEHNLPSQQFRKNCIFFNILESLSIDSHSYKVAVNSHKSGFENHKFKLWKNNRMMSWILDWQPLFYLMHAHMLRSVTPAVMFASAGTFSLFHLICSTDLESCPPRQMNDLTGRQLRWGSAYQLSESKFQSLLQRTN